MAQKDQLGGILETALKAGMAAGIGYGIYKLFQSNNKPEASRDAPLCFGDPTEDDFFPRGATIHLIDDLEQCRNTMRELKTYDIEALFQYYFYKYYFTHSSIISETWVNTMWLVLIVSG